MNFNKYLVKIIKLLLLACLLSPLLVCLESFIFPFIVPKVLFFRAVVLLAFSLYLILLWRDKRWFPPWHNLLLVVGIFTGIAFLSALLGADWHNSWWGDFERMEGLFTLVCLFIYLCLLPIFFRSKKDWFLFLNMLLLVGAIVVILGIPQLLVSQDKPFLTLGHSKRAYSTLGNFIYYGQFGLLLFWFSVLANFLLDKGDKIKRYFYITTVALGVLGIYFSGSRGPLLAWFVSLAVFGVGSFFVTKKKILKGAALGLTGVLVIVLLLAIFSNTFNSSFRALSGLQEIHSLTGTADTRLMAWGIAWQGFLEKPILGWGWFNYYVVFNKYYHPEFLEHGWAETWFDHAHNQYFDILATTGVLGLLSYLSIFVLLFYYLYKLKQRGSFSGWAMLCAMSLLVAHLINNIFVFEHPSSYLMLFSFIALVVGWGRVENIESKLVKTRKQSMSFKFFLLVLFLLVVCWQYQGNFLAYQINTTDLKLQALFLHDPVKGVPLMVQAVEKMQGPYLRDMRNDFGQAISNIGQVEADSPLATLYRQNLSEGIKMLEDNLQAYPLDARRQLVLTQMYKSLYFAGDETVLERMAEIFPGLAELSPRRQQIYYYWSELKLLQNDYDSAITLVKKTIEDDPDVVHGYWLLTKIEGSRGNWVAAKEYLDMAYSKGFQPSSDQIFFVNVINENLN